MIEIASGLAMVPIWIVGIVLAFRGRQRHPQVALAAGLAFAASIVLAGTEVAIRVWRAHHEADGRFQQSLAFANHIVFPVVSATAWILLICAVFGWRGGTTAEEERRPPLQTKMKASATISGPVVVGAFVGGCFGALIASALCETAPELLIQLGTTTSIAIVLVAGWGAVAGAAVTATIGGARGAILGGVTGLVVVFAWAANQDPQGAANIGWGLACGWEALNRNRVG